MLGLAQRPRALDKEQRAMDTERSQLNSLRLGCGCGNAGREVPLPLLL